MSETKIDDRWMTYCFHCSKTIIKDSLTHDHAKRAGITHLIARDILSVFDPLYEDKSRAFLLTKIQNGVKYFTMDLDQTYTISKDNVVLNGNKFDLIVYDDLTPECGRCRNGMVCEHQRTRGW